MRVLTVSAAKWGIQNAVYNLLNKSTETDCPDEFTHVTLPIHKTPDKINRVEFLSERMLDRLDRFRPLYLFYAIYLFWLLSYHHMKQHRDSYEILWIHSPRLLIFHPRSLDEKTVVTIHGNLMKRRAEQHDSIEHYYYRLLGFIQEIGIKRKSNLTYTVVQDDIAADLQTMGVPSTNIHRIGNGVDTDTFRPDTGPGDIETQSNDSEITLLFVGRFTELKRPLKIIELFNEIDADFADPIELIMVGEGLLREDTEELIREYNLQDTVTLAGIVAHEKINKVYASADVFMLLSSYEGEPLVLYEAMASGLPSIVSDIPSCRFVEKHDLGICIDIKDWNTAVKKVAKYLKKDYTQHGEKAREYALQELTWGARLEEYRTVFESLDSS